MSLRISDALIIVAVLLAASWMISIGRNVQLPLGLPRNLLIWLAILATSASFALSWRDAMRKDKERRERDGPKDPDGS
jgi:hypothetical protein